MTPQVSETAAQSSPATPAPADARGPHLRGVSGGKQHGTHEAPFPQCVSSDPCPAGCVEPGAILRASA